MKIRLNVHHVIKKNTGASISQSVAASFGSASQAPGSIFHDENGRNSDGRIWAARYLHVY
jgi:hypothetical protein